MIMSLLTMRLALQGKAGEGNGRGASTKRKQRNGGAGDDAVDADSARNRIAQRAGDGPDPTRPRVTCGAGTLSGLTSTHTTPRYALLTRHPFFLSKERTSKPGRVTSTGGRQSPSARSQRVTSRRLSLKRFTKENRCVLSENY